MEIPKYILLLFLLICSCGESLDCVQKLMPCQPYLKGSSSPPATCCVPLKEIVMDDLQCLCAVFNNPAILQSLNVTRADGLNLAKACGANADASTCKTAAAPSIPATPSSTSANSSTPSPKKHKNAAKTLSYDVEGYVSVAATILICIISAF